MCKDDGAMKEEISKNTGSPTISTRAKEVLGDCCQLVEFVMDVRNY